MKAWLLKTISSLDQVSFPLELAEVPVPNPKGSEVRIKVHCCGICHTELDEIEGRTPPEKFPIIPGHQVVGIVEKCGSQTKYLKRGDRVGVAWIFSACGDCEYCHAGLENLCPDFKATGRDYNGGYAQYMVVDERFAYLIPPAFSDIEAAPLLCAGAIGYRSLKLSGISDGQILALTGFGASGHLVSKMSLHMFPNTPLFVFARSREEQRFARDLGASWAGQITDKPPQKAHAIIDTTPVWNTVLGSLSHLKPGGRLVINAIRKESSDLDTLMHISYQDHLWMEKEIKTVANITRSDVAEFLNLAASIPIIPAVETYPFTEANKAIMDLKQKHVKGAKVLVVN